MISIKNYEQARFTVDTNPIKEINNISHSNIKSEKSNKDILELSDYSAGLNSRAERVEYLKNKYSTGEYKVNIEKIANSIIDELDVYKIAGLL